MRPERRNLVALRRRLDWLETRIGQFERRGEDPGGWMMSERRALHWALHLLEPVAVEAEAEGRREAAS